MLTDRRTAIAAGAALTTLIATGACSQDADTPAASPTADPAAGPSGLMEVIHVFAGEDGVSHVNRVKVTGSPKPLPAHSVVTTSIAQGTEDWHVAPAKTFTINVVGDIEAEVSDGTKVRIGKGDLVYLEDRTGKGHITRLLSPVTALFIVPDEGFDLRAWAAGQPPAK